MFALRGGYIGNHDSAKFAAGGSINLPMSGLGKVAIDYSYTDFGVLDMVHQVSLGFEF